MIQLQLLNKVLTDKSLCILNNNNIDRNYFNQYLEEYEFITNHYREYGNVPDDETILAKFPDFELLNVNENEKYLIETIQEEYLYNQCVPILNKSAELLQGNSQEAVEYLLPRIRELLVNCTYAAGTDIMANPLERLEEVARRKESGGMLGISSGLPEMDEILGGWMPGEELVTIAGRPNMGKSWILLFFLAKAWEQGKRVLLYSGEMSSLSVAFRTDTLLTHISNISMTRGTIDEKSSKIYEAELNRMKNHQVPFIVVTPKDLGGKRMTVPMLESLVEKYNPDIIGIDQFSLMADYRSNRDPIRVQLTHIAEDLFNLSEKYGKPVLADAQANRKSSDKDSPEAPELDEIGESDGIGQNSTRVITLVQAPSGLILSIKKNRYGMNNKNLSYCWDIDKGTFDYLPTRGIERSASEPQAENLRARNTRGRQMQEEQFRDGSDVF